MTILDNMIYIIILLLNYNLYMQGLYSYRICYLEAHACSYSVHVDCGFAQCIANRAEGPAVLHLRV